ncbi:hypothetical protein AA0481_0584 [Acetobacter orientalis NRIC 0481]|uniref:Uncharacterized protein n=1 Tax=Acetobacter orientalis TaxID=146474 RepID=A0A0D6NLG9_9PROT|nr:hypothetical protein Abor_031_055 [Acetobacter orientalis]GBR14331.1 hypothetical protein AA0481_0584 [Acetobacter orientalis NRIC 0481]GEL60866.1 hypothetical protein AOR02nite_07080 [Acetobacter orientalis]
MKKFTVGQRVSVPARQEPEVAGTIAEIKNTQAGHVVVIDTDDGWPILTEARRLKSLEPVDPVLPPEGTGGVTHWLRDRDGSLWPFTWSIWEDVWLTYNSKLTPQKAGALGFVYAGPCVEIEE